MKVLWDSVENLGGVVTLN